MSDAPDRRHRHEIVADLVAERKRTYDLERENAALREADTGDMVLVPREPKRGLLCGDVAISTDPRYAGWVFVRHVDGENWTTGAKLTPETWAMLAAAEEERSRG